jgi:hypothetical protein
MRFKVVGGLPSNRPFSAKGLIGDKELAIMKRGAFLVNFEIMNNDPLQTSENRSVC